VYSGDDALTLPFLAVGACGVVSVASHIAGERIAAMIAAFSAGDTAGALALHMSMLDLFEVLFADASPIPVKAAVALAGLPAGPTRPPLVAPTDELVAALRRVIDAQRSTRSLVPQTAN
jgi:4-hydroxy-tetrahydrodipicolinate synthase